MTEEHNEMEQMMGEHAHDMAPHVHYVTMWTPEGFIAVREDDPRLVAQTALHQRLGNIEERLQMLEAMHQEGSHDPDE